MRCITITYGYYALNDILTEDTDKPTNPWLDLILESNKNKKEPTKLWNLVQNEIANIKKFRLDEQSAVRYARRIFGDQYELPFRILRNISALEYTATINLGNTRHINVNFRNAKFNLPVDFVRSHFEKAVIFDNAYFCEEADFTDCIFDKAVSFDRTRNLLFLPRKIVMTKNYYLMLGSRPTQISNIVNLVAHWNFVSMG